MDRGELLQISHLPEAEHSALPPSKWEVAIFGAVILVPANFLTILDSNHLHSRSI